MNDITSKDSGASTLPSRKLRRDNIAAAPEQRDHALPVPAELAANLVLYGDETLVAVLPPGRALPPLGFETARVGLGGGWSLVFLALVRNAALEEEVRREIRMRGADPDVVMPPGTFDRSRCGWGVGSQLVEPAAARPTIALDRTE